MGSLRFLLAISARFYCMLEFFGISAGTWRYGGAVLLRHIRLLHVAHPQ